MLDAHAAVQWSQQQPPAASEREWLLWLISASGKASTAKFWVLTIVVPLHQLPGDALHSMDLVVHADGRPSTAIARE